VIPAVAGVVIAADQVTKQLALQDLTEGVPKHVLGPTNLLLTFNKGTAFSIGTGVAPIVEAIVIVLVVWLVLASLRAGRSASAVALVGLGLLLGGALGNLSDRVFRHHHGAVVDFIQAVSWWPVFNVADASIVIGVIVLILSYWSGSIQIGSLSGAANG
jgi:signal peptidase II